MKYFIVTMLLFVLLIPAAMAGKKQPPEIGKPRKTEFVEVCL